MTGKHRRELTNALEARGTRACVNIQCLSDALGDAGLTLCRVRLVADLSEALSDIYTGHTRGTWPAEGRDACLSRVLSLLGNGRVDDATTE